MLSFGPDANGSKREHSAYKKYKSRDAVFLIGTRIQKYALGEGSQVMQPS